MVLPERGNWLAGVSLLLSGVGLVAVVMLVGQQQNIFSRAWSGITANTANLRLQLRLAPETSPLPTAARSKDLYDKLTQAYPTVEKAVIDLPALGIQGEAYLHHDSLIDKTFVFSRIENLPLVEGRIVGLWLTDGQVYSPVGISEFVEEGGQTVAYSVFVKEGDLKSEFKEWVFSYDMPTQATAPAASFLKLRF